MLWQSCHINMLRLAKTGDPLTGSQKGVCESIQQAIADHRQRINLWGTPGVGKTFLAHHLHYAIGFSYSPSIESLKLSECGASSSVTIIDNAPHERKLARRIFGDILWSGTCAAILVTREPIDDAVRRINLSLTDDDIKQIEELVGQNPGSSIIENSDSYDVQKYGIWALLKDFISNS